MLVDLQSLVYSQQQQQQQQHGIIRCISAATCITSLFIITAQRRQLRSKNYVPGDRYKHKLDCLNSSQTYKHFNQYNSNIFIPLPTKSHSMLCAHLKEENK